jgi:aryl sulfotransferase
MLTWRDGWPVKTRELHNHHFDSTAWNDFAFRDDDIVIATYAKAGTTWTQQSVGRRVFAGAEDVPARCAPGAWRR